MEKRFPDYDAAILEFDKAIGLGINDPKVYCNRGVAYVEKPNPDYTKALADFDKAIELGIRDALAYTNRGGAHMEKPNPDYKKALSDLNKALKLDPYDSLGYYLRSRAHAALGNCVKARSDYYTATEMTPGIAMQPLHPALKKCLEIS